MMISRPSCLLVGFFVVLPWLMDTPASVYPRIDNCRLSNESLASLYFIARVFEEVEAEHGHTEASQVHKQMAERYRDELLAHVTFNNTYVTD